MVLPFTELANGKHRVNCARIIVGGKSYDHGQEIGRGAWECIKVHKLYDLGYLDCDNLVDPDGLINFDRSRSFPNNGIEQEAAADAEDEARIAAIDPEELAEWEEDLKNGQIDDREFGV